VTLRQDHGHRSGAVLATATGAQVPTSLAIKDLAIYGSYMPTRTGEFNMTLLLGELTTNDQQVFMRTVQQQMIDLKTAVEAASWGTSYQSPDGRVNTAVFETLNFREATFFDEQRELSWPTYIAELTGNILSSTTA
jgi:hypothetical protein